MKRYLLLSLTTIPVFVAFGSGCKKEVPTVEAGVVATPVAADEAGAAPVADVDAGPAATLATTTPKVVPAAPKDAGGPAPAAFAGTYSCFGGMTLSQAGINVSGRRDPSNQKDYQTIACNVSGDNCDGTATVYKDGKVSGTKKFSMKRNPANNDIKYQGESEPQTACHKR